MKRPNLNCQTRMGWALKPLACSALALVLAACSLPRVSQAPASAQPAIPAQWGAAAPATQAPAQLQSAWWQAFGDAELDAWVALALAQSNDVLLAMTRVDEARANLELAGAAALPQVSATAPLSAGRSLGARGLTQTRSIQPGLQASWELDLWNRLGDLRSAADLRLQASQADGDAVQLAVAATTAQAYIGLRSLQAQLGVAQSTLQSREAAVRLLTDQVRVGYISQLQQSQALAELESVKQSIEQLSLALERQSLALLQLVGGIGDAAAQKLMHETLQPGVAARQLRLQAIAVPALPAMGLPSDLLERRPDIARAQFQLAASDKQLAAQRASFLPQVSLSANLGSLLINALDYHPATVWGLGGSILAPLFSGGRLQAQFDVANAQRDQAAYAYRGTVIKALGDVQSALVGTQYLQTQWASARQREAVLQRTLGFAKDRYEAGYASYLEELDAQRNLFAVQQEVIRLRQSQLENAVQLYQALGGGWQKAASAAAETPEK